MYGLLLGVCKAYYRDPLRHSNLSRVSTRKIPHTLRPNPEILNPQPEPPNAEAQNLGSYSLDEMRSIHEHGRPNILSKNMTVLIVGGPTSFWKLTSVSCKQKNRHLGDWQVTLIDWLVD